MIEALVDNRPTNNKVFHLFGKRFVIAIAPKGGSWGHAVQPDNAGQSISQIKCFGYSKTVYQEPRGSMVLGDVTCGRYSLSWCIRKEIKWGQ